ncbi:M61 family peptidase, partial [bacterium]
MRGAIALLAAGIAPAAFATIDYTVKPLDGELEIKMAFEAKGPTTLKMPNWAPGAYSYSYPGKAVKALAVSRGALVTKEGDNVWKLDATGPVTVTYRVPAPVSDGTIHYSGPATYLYVDGRKEEDCRLTFDIPRTFMIAVGLNPVGRNDRLYTAPTYDVLADNPVTMGQFLMDTYTVRGKPHFIAMRGVAKSKVNRAYLKKACKFITEMQGDFFGGLPYDRYVWHFAVNDRPDGAGGLEHLSSTQISLAAGVGPRAVGVLSHEFFHLWNVKRIRSAPLGPFDYDTLPQTGSLWWLEGVTDYYAHTLLPRYGWWKEQDLYNDVAANVRTVRARPQRLEVSPFDASYRVREAANGRGNSQGLGVSYYDTGWLVGMVLDLAIIDETDGRESLDSVEHALWARYRRDPSAGFPDEEIGRLVRLYGGRKVGELYETVALKPGELPVEAALARAGLELTQVERKSLRLKGLTLVPNVEAGNPVVATRAGEEPLFKAGTRIASI